MPLKTKIDIIEIQNFKFFHKLEVPLKINGKHLLLFGENGSGKSSLYWALYTLLEASNKEDAEEIKKYFDYTNDEKLLNINIEQNLPNTPESFIKLSFTDDTKPFYVSIKDTSINKNNDAKNSNFSSDFITYRHLLNLYNFAHSEEIDVFHFFKYAVLPYVKFSPVKYWRKNNGAIEDFTSDSANHILDFVYRGPKKDKKNKNGGNRYPIRKETEYGDFNNIVNGFYSNLEQLVTYINTEGNPILRNELGYDITFKLILDKERILKNAKRYKNEDGIIFTDVLFPNKNTSIKTTDFHRDSFALTEQYYDAPKFHIWLKITEYEGKKDVIKRAHSFLNEAKLTAVALAIRLAVLKRTLSVESKLKLLVFDDLMISLDMSNREKVMNLILNKYINEYQVFILTHDRALFEDTKTHIRYHYLEAEKQLRTNSGLTVLDDKISDVSLKKFHDEWNIYEMYQAELEKNIQYPFITRNESAIQKAIYYFKENIDYYACGNNLRTALEKYFKELIPVTEFINDKNKHISKEGIENLTLGPLLNYADKFFVKVGFKTDVLIKLDRFKSRSLNPLSHYNPKSNYYRKELEDVFNIYFKLQEIKIINLLNCNDIISFMVETSEGATFTYRIKLQDDLKIYKDIGKDVYVLNSNDKLNFAICSCTIDNNKSDIFNSRITGKITFKRLYEDTLKGIKNKFRKNPIKEPRIVSIIKNTSNLSVDDLLNQINNIQPNAQPIL